MHSCVDVVMGSYPMPLYCVPLFITLVGPYFMYRIRTCLALNCTLDSQNLHLFARICDKPGSSMFVAHEYSVVSGKWPRFAGSMVVSGDSLAPLKMQACFAVSSQSMYWSTCYSVGLTLGSKIQYAI